jgi:hypothetical protein
MAFVNGGALGDIANTVFVPLIGILVGLSFAWGANAHALLQSREIRLMIRHRAGGMPEYAFTFQLAILVTLTTLAAWGLAGLRIFDVAWPTMMRPFVYGAIESVLFALASLTIRECWHVVVGTQQMLIEFDEIRTELDGEGSPTD